MTRHTTSARASSTPHKTRRAPAGPVGRVASALVHGLAWIALAALALQLFFVARIALLAVFDPASTAFQRTQLLALLSKGRGWRDWQQQWVPLERIAPSLRRAVVAAEDAGFMRHFGVDWAAIEAARARNERRLAAAQRAASAGRVRPARIAGGSTITQQLAKNLFLSGERTLWRKGQELLLTWMLEALLDKRRILEIYLNSVEWGEGIFGAEAAARRYFGKSATQLTPAEAARLAVLLPAPKRYERQFGSAYLSQRAQLILGRMPAVEAP